MKTEIAPIAVSAASGARSRPWARVDLALVVVVLVAVGLRLLYVTAPYAAAHSWRQIMNADIARNFLEGPFNILYPRVSWGGTQEYVGIEFPLLQAVVAGIYAIVGEREIVGRLVSIACSGLTVVLVYLLGRACVGRGHGLAAAAFLAVSPSAVFFGRSFMSDVPMLLFSVAAVLAYARYLATGHRTTAVIGAVCLALACLTKLSAVIILAPIVSMAWSRRRWSIVGDRWLVLGLAMAMAPVVAWYGHSHLVHESTGLGVAVFSPSGTYEPAVSAFAGDWTRPSIWSGALFDGQMYLSLARRAWTLHFTPIGSLCVLLGIARLWNVRARRLEHGWLLAWFLAVILEIIVTGPGQVDNEYYQLPLLLPAALLVGLAIGRWFESPGVARWRAGLGAVVVAAVVGCVTFVQSHVIRDYYRPERLDLYTVGAGLALDATVEPDALLITVQFDRAGANSPLLLYRAHRRGWSFDRQALAMPLIERLRTLGARYLTTQEWPQLLEQRPDIVWYLRGYRSVPVVGPEYELVLFDLTTPIRRLPEGSAAMARTHLLGFESLGEVCRDGAEPSRIFASLLTRLRSSDRRWGFNWKRGEVGDLSQDALAYHWGDDDPEGSVNVSIVRVVEDACGTPRPGWTDLTIDTARLGVIGRWTLVPLAAYDSQPR